MVVLKKHSSQYGGDQALSSNMMEEWGERIRPFSQEYRNNHPLKGIYVGGGTPSLLPAAIYKEWLEKIQLSWPLAPDAEITMEANPNAWASQPRDYLQAGFNRLSIGIQSLNDLELKALSRIHTSEEAMNCVRTCQDAGFTNISVDMMVGIPKQTRESWAETLQKLVSLDVQHVSMYGLQVEEATPLHQLVNMGAYPLPTEDEHVAMKRFGVRFLEDAGYRAYEFSNLSKSGYASRHNQNYWQQGDYLALGPGAHGYVHPKRYANSRDMEQWLNNPTESSKVQSVSDDERLENVMIFGLRQTAGVDREAVIQQFGVDVLDRFAPQIGKWIERGALLWEQGTRRVRFHPDWEATSNTVLADFIS